MRQFSKLKRGFWKDEQVSPGACRPTTMHRRTYKPGMKKNEPQSKRRWRLKMLRKREKGSGSTLGLKWVHLYGGLQQPQFRVEKEALEAQLFTWGKGDKFPKEIISTHNLLMERKRNQKVNWEENEVNGKNRLEGRRNAELQKRAEWKRKLEIS